MSLVVGTVFELSAHSNSLIASNSLFIIGFFHPQVRWMIIQSLITSRHDFCNILYLGVTKYVKNRLQIAQNAAVKLLFHLPKFSAASTLLCKLHWFSIEKRIQFKALCIAHMIINRKGASSLESVLQPYNPIGPFSRLLEFGGEIPHQ